MFSTSPKYVFEYFHRYFWATFPSEQMCPNNWCNWSVNEHLLIYFCPFIQKTLPTNISNKSIFVCICIPKATQVFKFILHKNLRLSLTTNFASQSFIWWPNPIWSFSFRNLRMIFLLILTLPKIRFMFIIVFLKVHDRHDPAYQSVSI